MYRKILSETKVSHYVLIHLRALHTSSSTSKYDSNINSIKSDHFTLGQNINRYIKPKTIILK